MRRSRLILALMAPVVLIGIRNLLHFSEKLFNVSQDVRVMDIIGLATGGAACGVALPGVMFALLSRNRAPELPMTAATQPMR